ncbi:MAG: hypothetical protein KA144_14410 [Xanthomonadaceae bacterium]|nr:hypothetical protein [Xanthomonadaceae bacterium]
MAVTSGCSITREVRSVSLDPGEKEICIIEAPAVREGFLQTYRTELEKKGFVVRLLPPNSATTTCPLTSTYLGKWSWDLALYLNYAEINVYKNGEQSGRALYDGRRGGANLGKFGSGEKRIAGLVNELFP